MISKQSTHLDKEEEKKEKFNFAVFSSYFDTVTIAAGKGVDGEGGCRRAGADAATEEDSADAHCGVVQAGDRSWPQRRTTPPLNQTWRRRTTPGQRDATINLWGPWTNH